MPLSHASVARATDKHVFNTPKNIVEKLHQFLKFNYTDNKHIEKKMILKSKLNLKDI